MQDRRMMDSTKLLWHMDRVMDHFDHGARISPIHVDMGIAKFCNVACVFCVAGTTKILMADFTWKEIKDVIVGDSVMGFDEEIPEENATARYYPTVVTKTFKRLAKTHKIKSERSDLKITGEHLMLCEGHKWVPVKEIKTGQKVHFYDRKISDAVQIEKLPNGEEGAQEDVYNLETESRTYVANGFCVHNCYGMYQTMQKVFIQREALLNAVSDFAEIGTKSLAFIGDGEPTCNPHCYEALRLGKDKGLSMAISTNGVLLDNDERIHAILSSCEWMRFCFSAGTREGYKAIHGKDYFDRALKNIIRTVQIKKESGYTCDIGLQAVFVPTIMGAEMIAEAKLAREVGVDYFLIKHCSLPDNGESGMANFDLNKYDSKEVDDVLTQCESMSTDTTVIVVKRDIMKRKGIRNYQGCPSIPFISEISGNGDWFPCGYMFGGKENFEKYKFGNVHDARVRDIVSSEKYWEIIRTMRQAFNVHTMCKGMCRQEMTNEFCWKYLQTPKGKNFI